MDALIPIAIVAGFGLLGWLITWGLKKLNLPAQAEATVLQFTQRVLDKSKEMIDIATSPDSDGGVKITKAEASKIRDQVFKLLEKEATGPVGKFLMGLAENQLKGLIGLALKKLGVGAATE